MSDPLAVYHWHRIDTLITTSGQPTEAQLAQIAGLGVRYVINLGLHSHEKALRDEAATVAALGMVYVHIPVDFQNPTEHDFRLFRDAMTSAGDALVHVHCIANYRVSAFVYRYRRERGVTEDRARADLDRVWQPDPVWGAFIEHTI
jgi:uncharacterized protein (TIGR01244 family)